MLWGGIGAAGAFIAALLLAIKWKLPLRLALPGSFLGALVIAVPAAWLYPNISAVWRPLAAGAQIICTIVLLSSIILWRFWRDPERRIPNTNDRVLAPADGKVIYIRTVPPGTLPIISKDNIDYSLKDFGVTLSFNHDVCVIGIEMSLTDVHINRSPISGKVELVKHIPGQFLSLRRSEAPFLNTRCITQIKSQAMTVAVIQIASRLVRRVDNYLEPGQIIVAGQRLGMIRFGSLVALILPLDKVRLNIKVGAEVRAGETILASYDEPNQGAQNGLETMV